MRQDLTSYPLLSSLFLFYSFSLWFLLPSGSGSGRSPAKNYLNRICGASFGWREASAAPKHYQFSLRLNPLINRLPPESPAYCPPQKSETRKGRRPAPIEGRPPPPASIFVRHQSTRIL